MSNRIWFAMKGGYELDPAMLSVPPMVELTFVRGLSYCKMERTQGHIPEEALPRVCLGMGDDYCVWAGKLVTAGLWEVIEDGYRVVAWDKWQYEKGKDRQEQSRKGHLSAHARGNHDNNPRPDVCDRCADNQNVDSSPFPDEPVVQPTQPVVASGQPTYTGTSTGTDQKSGTEQLKGVEQEPLIVLEEFQTEDRSDVGEVLQALLDVRRRVTNAPNWEPQHQKLRQWHESASLLAEQYGWEHVVATLARVTTNLHPSLFKPFAQTPSKSRVGDAFAAVAAELGSTWSPGAKPVPVSTGPSGFELEQMRHQARQEIASWGDES